MVQLREGTQKIVDMYNDKNNNNSYYMDDVFYRHDAYNGVLSQSYDKMVEYEHVLDDRKLDSTQALVNHAVSFADRDDRQFIDVILYDYDRWLKDSRVSDLPEDESKIVGHVIGHIRADDDSYELYDMKRTANQIYELEGGYKKYFISYRDLNDFDNDLKEQLSDKIADGISMNEVVENFNALSQTQETGNERVEQLDLNLDGLDNGEGLQR